MNDKLMEEVLALLEDALELDVETESVYTGGMDGSDLYEDSHTVTLKLNGKPISSIYLP